jgi:1,4-dihydroxy-2-naphthoate octaprenyltransferase
VKAARYIAAANFIGFTVLTRVIVHADRLCGLVVLLLLLLLLRVNKRVHTAQEAIGLQRTPALNAYTHETDM